MADEPDNNTLDNAGRIGVAAADKLTQHVITAVGGFPDSEQRQAIARIVANNLYDWIEENER